MAVLVNFATLRRFCSTKNARKLHVPAVYGHGIAMPLRRLIIETHFEIFSKSVNNPSNGIEKNFRPVSKAVLAALKPGDPLNWSDYIEAHHPGFLGDVLDYGCSRGSMLHRVKPRSGELHGVDVDDLKFPDDAAAKGLFLRKISPDGQLPYPESRFDTIIITEVIEHVPDERHVFSELNRVLKPGGYLLLTTPHRGLLTWLDPANYKFVFPTLHRLIHCYVLRKKDYYEKRFGAQAIKERGLIGDITAYEDPRHKHYSIRDLVSFAPETLEPIQWAVYFPAMRALWAISIALGIVTRRKDIGTSSAVPGFIKAINRHLSRVASVSGDQLVVCFRKRITN